MDRLVQAVIEIDKNIDYKKSNKKLVHENYLCTWIGKPKKIKES